MKASDYLSPEEREHFRSPSDGAAIAQVATNCLINVGAFALFGLWSNPLTFVDGPPGALAPVYRAVIRTCIGDRAERSAIIPRAGRRRTCSLSSKQDD